MEEIDAKFYRILKQFSPFGPGNKNPILLSRNVKLDKNPRFIGKDKSHVKLNFYRENSAAIDAIGFGFAPIFKTLNNNLLSICYSLDENTWRNVTSLQINLRDVVL